MSDFIERMAARAAGHEVTGRPRMHLRRRGRFEPQPVARQAVPSESPMPADRPPASDGEPAPVAPAVVPPPAPPAPPAPQAEPPPVAPVAVPDPLVIVQERVVPALVEAGVLAADERVEVVDAEGTEAPPGPEVVQLRVASPSYPAQPAAVPETRVDLSRAPAEIHVHIDRIDVVRPDPQPLPRPAAPRPRIVDHAEYLSRRRERR